MASVRVEKDLKVNPSLLVTKRNGQTERINLDKIHKVLDWAATGLSDVKVSRIFDIQFPFTLREVMEEVSGQCLAGPQLSPLVSTLFYSKNRGQLIIITPSIKPYRMLIFKLLTEVCKLARSPPNPIIFYVIKL